MDLAQLPEYLFTSCFPWLDVSDLCQVSQVSSSCRRPSETAELWQRFEALRPRHLRTVLPGETPKALYARLRHSGWYDSLDLGQPGRPSRLSLEYRLVEQGDAVGQMVCHLLLDGIPLYVIGANCNTLSCNFAPLAPAVDFAVVDRLAWALNGEGPADLDAELEEALSELLPPGPYTCCNFAYVPTVVNCRDQKCVMDFDSDGDYVDEDPEYVPIHRPDLEYYLGWCKDGYLPVNMRFTPVTDRARVYPHARRYPHYLENIEHRLFAEASAQVPSIQERFKPVTAPKKRFHVVTLPTQQRSSLDETRVQHYMDRLRAGYQPTVLCLSVMDLGKDHFLYRNERALVVGDYYLKQWVLDGHHKLEAATRTGLPVRILSYCLAGNSNQWEPRGTRSSYAMVSQPTIEAMEALTAGIVSLQHCPPMEDHKLDRLGDCPLTVMFRSPVQPDVRATYADCVGFLRGWYCHNFSRNELIVTSLDGIPIEDAEQSNKVVGLWIEVLVPDKASAAIIVRSSGSARGGLGADYPAVFRDRRAEIRAFPVTPRHSENASGAGQGELAV